MGEVGLLQRLDAAEAALITAKETAAHASVSRGQSDLVMALLGECQVSFEGLGLIAERIGRCPWATPDEKEGLLKALGLAVAVGKSPRAKQQNYEHLGNYFMPSQWEVLLGSEHDYGTKLAILAEHAFCLGLRNPTEPTAARMTGLLLVCLEGAARARCLSPGHLHDVFVHVKDAIKTRAKSPALETIPELSPTVMEFKAKHSSTYKAVFGDQSPIACQLAMPSVVAVGQNLSMRNRRKGSQSQQSASSNPSVDLAATMQQFMVQMMQTMSGNTSLQNGANLQMMGGQRPHASLRPVLERASSLVDMPHSPGRGSSTSTLLPLALRNTAFEAPIAEASLQIPRASFATPVAAAALEIIEVPHAAVAVMPEAPVAVLSGVPPPKKFKKTIEEATADILRAMSKKTLAKESAKEVVSKRPAAAPTSAILSSSCAGVHVAESSCKPPSFSIEKSRSQVQFRTGLAGPGQSKVIKYTDEATMQQAIKVAEKMIAQEARKRGL